MACPAAAEQWLRGRANNPPEHPGKDQAVRRVKRVTICQPAESHGTEDRRLTDCGAIGSGRDLELQPVCPAVTIALKGSSRVSVGTRRALARSSRETPAAPDRTIRNARFPASGTSLSQLPSHSQNDFLHIEVSRVAGAASQSARLVD